MSKKYAVCEFTIVSGGLDTVYNKGEIVDLKAPAIIEFAAVKFNCNEVIEQFHTFAQMDGIEPAVLAFDEHPSFRGVTPSMLIGAPALEDALRAFHAFTKGNTLVLREDWHTEPWKNLRKTGRKHGIRFNNKVIKINDIVTAADVLNQYYRIGKFNLMKIAANMRTPCEWKDVFYEYEIPFGRDDCIGYALAFAELIIELMKRS